MRIVLVIFVLLAVIFAVVFALQNSMQVAIAFFSWSTTGSLSLVLILTFSVGLLLGILIMSSSFFRRYLQFSGLRKRFKKLEKENAGLTEKVTECEDSKNAKNPENNSNT